MTHISNLVLGTAALALLVAVTSNVDARVAASPAPQNCVPAASTHPRVADRLERVIEACERGHDAPADPAQSAASERTAACVTSARRDGFRPADRLERIITLCVRDAG